MKILLAADGSEYTRAAVDLVARLPRPEGTTVTVLSVVPSLEAKTPDEPATAIEDARRTVREDAGRVLDDAVERLRDAGIAVEATLAEGRVAPAILEQAEAAETDLVVVGAQGLRRIGHFLLGSVADTVVTFAPCSVLVARPGAGGPTGPARILVAADGSEPSRKAIAALAGLGREPWCAVRIVTVLELVTAFRLDIRQRLAASWRAKRRGAERELREAAETLSASATEVQTEVVEASDAGEAILDAAAAFGADLVVVGATGRSRVDRVVLGSVSSRIVRHAPVSVWVGR